MDPSVFKCHILKLWFIYLANFWDCLACVWDFYPLAVLASLRNVTDKLKWTAPLLYRNNVPVTLDNPHTSLWTVLFGAALADSEGCGLSTVTKMLFVEEMSPLIFSALVGQSVSLQLLDGLTDFSFNTTMGCSPNDSSWWLDWTFYLNFFNSETRKTNDIPIIRSNTLCVLLICKC